MSARAGTLGIKRKRPASDGSGKELTPDEQDIYKLIKSKGDLGIWKGDIKKELKMAATSKSFDNCIKSLQMKQMIKEIADVQPKGKKRLMAMEFEPSKELTGGVWYQDGMLDEELIEELKKFCKRKLEKQKVDTADGIRHAIKMTGAFNVDLTVDQVKEVLDNLVLEKAVITVKGNGMGELSSFPIGADCYKTKSQGTKVGAFAIAPDGIISLATCVIHKMRTLEDLMELGCGNLILKINQLKDEIEADRSVQIKEKLDKNRKKLQIHIRGVLSAPSEVNTSSIDNSCEAPQLETKVTYVLNCFVPGSEDDDLPSIHEVAVVKCNKLPKTQSIPPYTTWIFLDSNIKNQRMAEDQYVVGRKRIYYDKSGNESLICSDSDNETAEIEGEKRDFSEGEDRILCGSC